MPVSDVTTADVLAILTPIWHDKPETARRVRQRIGAVMKWAVAMGYRPDNPAGDALGQALGRQRAVVQHMRALPHGAVADALATVRTSRALVTTKDGRGAPGGPRLRVGGAAVGGAEARMHGGDAAEVGAAGAA